MKGMKMVSETLKAGETMMNSGRPFASLRIETASLEWKAVADSIRRAMRLSSELNKLAFDDTPKIREIFSELIDQKVDDTFTLIPPFYSAYGLDIRIGHKVFINQCCTLYDMGGLEIGDNVMIGPNVSLITTSHPLDPIQRRAFIEARPIKIENDVWLAAGAMIIGGVTVGKNSVVAAGSVVTRDVPPDSFVAGVPAKVIRSLYGEPDLSLYKIDFDRGSGHTA